MNIAADFLGSWYYISSSGILIKAFELMRHKCNHLCNRLFHFHDLVDVWPFLSAWSAVRDLWPMVLVLARYIPGQSLINFIHRLCVQLLILLCPTTSQLVWPKNGQCSVRSCLCLLFAPLEIITHPFALLEKQRWGWHARLWLQLLISAVCVVCCDDLLLHQQSYGCLTLVLPHFDPPQCTTAGMWKHNATYLFTSSWMKQQEAEPNILAECEFGRVHILAWKQSCSLYRKSAGLEKHWI